MPRKKRSQSKLFPFHISARSNNREWFYLPKQEVWEICIDQLFNVSLVYELRVHAFILMDNHFHLLASTPEANLPANMNYFMRETSRTIGRSAERINHVFGGSYKATLIDNPYYYFNACRYLYQNPLRAHICETVEEYPFSTLSILFGQSKLALPVYTSIFDTNNFIMSHSQKAFCWLNKLADKEIYHAVSRGLTQPTFTPPRDRYTREIFEFPPEDLDEIDAFLNQTERRT